MELNKQKKLASVILKCSPKRVWLDPGKLASIKDALTRSDLKDLIGNGSIQKVPSQGQSRVRARQIAHQKSRGLQKGPGSRKGTANARLPTKLVWMRRVRLQRDFAKQLRDTNKVTPEVYRALYVKIKSNIFKDRNSLKLYLNDNGLFKK
jgi:large subunit ribosomal protein L19e